MAGTKYRGAKEIILSALSYIILHPLYALVIFSRLFKNYFQDNIHLANPIFN